MKKPSAFVCFLIALYFAGVVASWSDLMEDAVKGEVILSTADYIGLISLAFACARELKRPI